MVNNTSGADPSNVGYVQSSVTHALDATAALQTPANLADFQKSLVRFLVYEKNALSLAENANTDPVKTSLIFQNERLKYNVVLNEFKNQFEKAQTIKGFSLGAPTSGGKDAGLSFLGAILGIETAHAQWLTFDAANLGEMIWQYVQDIILQILKNTLISFIQNKVLKWIQGSGAPMFIQNWASDLVNAGEMSAINAINSNYACVNPNTVFPRVQIILNAIYKPGNNVCAMQFQSALSSGNLTNFFSNFSNGGFVTFGQTLMPSNDFYGGLFFTAQNAGKAAQQSQGVFSLKTTAQQGWQGVEKCADGSDPHGISKFCTQEGTTVEGSVNADGTCASGWTLQSRANNGQCADGSDPTTNSPGQITGQVFKTGMEGSPELITAANSIVGILNAMLSSLLNGLASMAVSAGSSAVAGATGIGSGSSGGSGVMGFSPSNSGPSGPALPGVSCLPAYQDIAFPTSTNQASVPFYAQGGATDSAGNQPTYSWSAPGSVSGSGGLNAGDPFTAIYDATGTYSISVVASTDNSNSTCTLVLD
jgi:hypothetical protein